MPETKITADELLSGQVRSRQGGHADDFSIPGTNNYSEARVNMQTAMGSATSNSAGVVSVTFEAPFATPPLIFLTPTGSSFAVPMMVSSTTTGFTFQAFSLLGALLNNIKVSWYAVGRRPMS